MVLRFSLWWLSHQTSSEWKRLYKQALNINKQKDRQHIFSPSDYKVRKKFLLYTIFPSGYSLEQNWTDGALCWRKEQKCMIRHTMTFHKETS